MEEMGAESLKGVNESELHREMVEAKFRSDLETLAANYIKAGGDAQRGAAVVNYLVTDLVGVAVLQAVQSEFKTVLAWLVSQVRELKGESDVPTDPDDTGEVAGQREDEDGEVGGVAVDSPDGREG